MVAVVEWKEKFVVILGVKNPVQRVRGVATRSLKIALNDLDDEDDERDVERSPPKCPQERVQA